MKRRSGHVQTHTDSPKRLRTADTHSTENEDTGNQDDKHPVDPNRVRHLEKANLGISSIDWTAEVGI